MNFFTSLSLKQRLLILLLTMIALVWGAVTFSAYHTVRYEMGKLLDTQMAQIAYSLLEINVDKIQKYEATIPDDVYRFLREDVDNLDIRYQVWKDDILQLHSLDAPDTRLVLPEGFTDREIEGEKWRIFYASIPGKINMDVTVMARRDIRSIFQHPLSELILMHMAAQMVFIIFIVWFAVSKGLTPLKNIATAISHRHYNDLRPLEEKSVPDEMKPVVGALNRLFERLKESFDKEKQFTNHAAHELRTPLASLKMQAQVAAREKDPDKQKKLLHNMERGVNRATHLVSQLLAMARLEPESERLEMEEMDLNQAVENVMEDLMLLAEDKGLEVKFEKAESCAMTGNLQTVRILVSNLLDNAIRYTPEGGHITVGTESKNGMVRLVVKDDGPGIPEEQRDKVFNRFYRIRGETSEGIGMGLSIVRKIADLHNARIDIHDNPDGDGTQIGVTFFTNGSYSANS